MLKHLLAASLALGTLTVAATPSFALIGIEAVHECVMNAPKGCQITTDPDGSVMIDSTSGMVHCNSLQAECTVMKAVAPGSKKPFVVPESLTSTSGNSDTGVPGTGSGGGFYQVAPINPGGGGQIQ